MATKQDIEKSELKEEIVKLKNENKEYEANLIKLRQQKQETSDSERKSDLAAEIRFFEGSKSANDRQIEEKEKQITLDRQINLELIRNQGKSAASTDSL